MSNEDTISPEMQRDLKRLHREMAEADAAGGVNPVKTIKSRKTGNVSHFGPRRAFDNAYVIELLGASGVTPEEAATCVYVLQPLVDVGLGDIDAKDIVETLSALGGMIRERPPYMENPMVIDGGKHEPT